MLMTLLGLKGIKKWFVPPYHNSLFEDIMVEPRPVDRIF